MIRRVLALMLACVAFSGLAQPPAGESFYVTAEVVPAVALVGEQVRYVVTAYSDTLRDVTLTPPAFPNFYQGDIRSVGSSATIGEKQYNVVTFAITLYPSTSGVLTIPPAEVVFEGTVLEVAHIAETNPAPLTAAAPPPVDGFSGLVGRHTVTFALDVTSVELGQPITAEFRVSGTGYVAGLPAPALVLPDGWRAYLDPAQVVNQSDGTVTTTEKIFRWRILPDRAGVLSVGVAPLTVYDFATSTYLPLTTDPLEVQVLAGENGETVRASAVAALENSNLGLPAATDSAVVPPPSIGWVLAPIAAVVAIALQAALRRVQAAQREARRKNALTLAKTRLSKAAKLTGDAALRAIEGAAAGYLRDKEREAVVGLREALILVESARYAPRVDDVNGLAAAVYAVLVQAESEADS